MANVMNKIKEWFVKSFWGVFCKLGVWETFCKKWVWKKFCVNTLYKKFDSYKGWIYLSPAIILLLIFLKRTER